MQRMQLPASPGRLMRRVQLPANPRLHPPRPRSSLLPLATCWRDLPPCVPAFDPTCCRLRIRCRVTLSIFPGVLAEDVHSAELGSWYPVALLAVFNLADWAGKSAPALPALRLGCAAGVRAACMLLHACRMLLHACCMPLAHHLQFALGHAWRATLCRSSASPPLPAATSGSSLCL